MEKEFVPYEQALELKELGFDEPCIACWSNRKSKNYYLYFGGIEYVEDEGYVNPMKGTIISAPTFSQAFRWFREKHGISVSISINWEEGIGKDSSYGKYACSLQHKSYDESIGEFIGVFKRYEEAELECLKELIEMVKENEL